MSLLILFHRVSFISCVWSDPRRWANADENETIQEQLRVHDGASRDVASHTLWEYTRAARDR